MAYNTVGIIGLGLIGGSLAKTIKKHLPDTKVYAYDTNSDLLKSAASSQIIDGFSDASVSILEPCDCIFLCAEVKENTQILHDLKPYINPLTVITDVSSVKAPVMMIIEDLGLSQNFIGGHPMAGSEKSGFENSTDYLLENAYYILTPTNNTPQSLVSSFSNFLKAIKAIPINFSAEFHDSATAAVSHFPHVLAACLVNLVKELDTEDEVLKTIAAGGFRDITRIASSSPKMWQQICQTNADSICTVIEFFRNILDATEGYIKSGNADALYNFFSNAKDYRDSLMINDKGSIESANEIFCDLKDEPGKISTITTLLSAHQVNIKNIGIVHNREFEDGALRLQFYDDATYKLAYLLLQKHNYIIHDR